LHTRSHIEGLLAQLTAAGIVTLGGESRSDLRDYFQKAENDLTIR
jgi:hypothetical protein